MITQSNDYLSLLHRIQDSNRQTKIIKLPADEPIYKVDLNTRKIEAPKFLSVEYDHNAETIYFEVDRFFDNVDLSTLFCVIQYQNANPDKTKRGHIYAVPYFDITTKAEENKMLFQWAIEGPATAYSGKVTFSIKFYKISSITIDSADGHSTQLKVYDYVLNTQPSISEVLHGMDFEYSEDYTYLIPDVDPFDNVYQALAQVAQQSDLYWIILNSDGTMNDPNFDRESITLPTEPDEEVNGSDANE